LAALSAATMANTTAYTCMEGSSIEKPKEWKTIDLVEQRKMFGQNISSLGQTSISRVWAAGTYSIVLNFIDYWLLVSGYWLLVHHPYHI